MAAASAPAASSARHASDIGVPAADGRLESLTMVSESMPGRGQAHSARRLSGSVSAGRVLVEPPERVGRRYAERGKHEHDVPGRHVGQSLDLVAAADAERRSTAAERTGTSAPSCRASSPGGSVIQARAPDGIERNQRRCAVANFLHRDRPAPESASSGAREHQRARRNVRQPPRRGPPPSIRGCAGRPARRARHTRATADHRAPRTPDRRSAARDWNTVRSRWYRRPERRRLAETG